MDFLTPYLSWADLHRTESLIVVAATLLLTAIALFRKLRPWTTHIGGRPILSANEREFFYRLTRALPSFHVFPQVSFSALIDVNRKLSAKQQFAIRRHFGWKYADFVICRKGTLDVVAVVELDDRTHNADNDRKRDAAMSAAGYPTVRFQSKHKPSEAEIAALFASARKEAS